MRFSLSAYLIRWMLILAVLLVVLNLLALAYRFPLYPAIAAVAIAVRGMRRWGGGDAYGSARSITLRELVRSRMLGETGLILGTCGYLERPSRWHGVRALFSRLPSPIACRLFLAAFFGRTWLER